MFSFLKIIVVGVGFKLSKSMFSLQKIVEIFAIIIFVKQLFGLRST